MVSMIGFNRVDGTRESVEALLKSSEHFSLSLTNQNSSDGTGAYFDEVKRRHPDRVTVFHETRNTFFQPPNNRAYRIAVEQGCEFFLCLNDDAIIPPDGLRQMMDVLDSRPNVAAVGAKGGCEEINHQFHGQPGRLDFVEGSCAMYRIAHLRRHRTTLFWDQLQGIYAEDAENSLFLQEKGYEIAKADFDLPHARSSTVNRDPQTQAACHAFQARNHELCRNRYAHWLKCRTFSYPIVIRRSMALGDVILTTPIIRAIKASNPLSDIHVQTDFPAVFANNPSVTRAAKAIPEMPNQLVVDINGAYEDAPMRHVLEAYEAKTREQVTGLGEVEWRTELFPSRKDMQWAQAMIAKAEGRPVCLIHGDVSHWPGKNPSQSLWDATASRLRKEGWRVFVVGTTTNEPAFGNDLDLRGQTGVLQLAALCAHAKLFLGPDSGPLHVSQAAGCPTIGVFGVTSARFLMTHGSKLSPVESPASIPSTGLRHRLTGITHLADGADAMASITPEQVWAGIIRLGIL
jgi:ADP-heptose:LPS heptosyltransferase/GT2 family glycosyltransferase